MLKCRETIVLLIVVVVYADFSNATRVQQCDSENFYEDPNEVRISSCDGPPCILKRKTTIEVEQRFKPNRNLQSLKTSINAVMFGVLQPYNGVDGVSACDYIFNADDGSKAGCPLTEGKEYIYKRSFHVFEIYPGMSVVVRFALNEGDSEVTCFKILVKITS